MLRFPNPGSDIAGFIRIFQALFEELSENQPFSLDDMSKTLIKRNLATSSGFMGEEALERSTRSDRSRDPLYNQSKSYSELYRLLGWLHPLPDNRLTFTFTYLGAHVAAARRDSTAIFRECILGIAYPTPNLEVLGRNRLRPFASILKMLADLEGVLCRDEMIVGVLNLDDDRATNAFENSVTRIRALRGNYIRLDTALAEISRARNITLVTMGNYTRFPLAVLEWCGWTRKERRSNVYGKSYVFHVLTDEGAAQVDWLNGVIDVRAGDLDGLSEDQSNAIIISSFYRLLERSGFDIEPIADLLETNEQLTVNTLGTSQLVFSPFQELGPARVQSLFPKTYEEKEKKAVTHEAVAVEYNNPTKALAKDDLFSAQVILREISEAAEGSEGEAVRLSGEIMALGEVLGNDEEAVIDMLINKFGRSNKDVFYPLVAELFCIIGYKCSVSRGGVNYQRWDALIEDVRESIPIEIKSPGEELFISVKAVRQAIENKVVFLARRPYPTEDDTTSLVVGFNPPNDRAEVAILIGNIYQTFGLSIGVIDFRSLVNLAVRQLIGNQEHDRAQLQKLRGIIDATNT